MGWSSPGCSSTGAVSRSRTGSSRCWIPRAAAGAAAGPDGRFRFRVPRDAARLEACVHARGLLRHQLTRIALREGRPEGDGLVFDIRLQGDGATTFFRQ